MKKAPKKVAVARLKAERDLLIRRLLAAQAAGLDGRVRDLRHRVVGVNRRLAKTVGRG